MSRKNVKPEPVVEQSEQPEPTVSAQSERLEQAELEYLNKLSQQEQALRLIAAPYRQHIAEKYKLNPKDQITASGTIQRFVGDVVTKQFPKAVE